MSVKLDLNQLKCLSIAKEDATLIGKLIGWAQGIEVFKVHDVLYLPEYGIPVWNGLVPEESINYPDHLDIRLGRTLGQALPSTSDHLLFSTAIDKSSEEVCILGNIYSRTFGHWTEELLKVTVLEAFGFDGPYIIPEGYPEFCHESLTLLGIPPKRVIAVSGPTIYKAALFPTTISHFTVHRFPGVLLQLRNRLYDVADKEVGVGDRIWVERGKNAHRPGNVVNKEEVYSSIRKYDFVSVDLGTYPLKNK